MELGQCSLRPAWSRSPIEGTKPPPDGAPSHEYAIYEKENQLTLDILARKFLVIQSGLSGFHGKAIPFDTLLDILGLIHDASASDGRRPSS